MRLAKTLPLAMLVLSVVLAACSSSSSGSSNPDAFFGDIVNGTDTHQDGTGTDNTNREGTTDTADHGNPESDATDHGITGSDVTDHGTTTDTNVPTDNGTDTNPTDTIVPIDTNPTDTNPTDTNPSDTTDTCTPCLQSSCGTQYTACGNSQDCVNLFNCIGACTDQTCANNCSTQYPNGVTTFNALTSCAQTSCDSQCFGSSDTVSDTVTDTNPGDTTDTCTPCLQSSCSSEYTACGNSQDCVNLNNCISACTDQTCADNCSTQYPNGVTPFNNLMTCAQNSCDTQCFSGGDTSGDTVTDGGDAADTCDPCLQSACSTQYNACGNSQDCVNLNNCEAACTDQSCITSCTTQYPNGVTPLNDLMTCAEANCASQCGG